MKFSWKNFENWQFLSRLFLFFFASFPWNQSKVSWLARLGWNYDQAKCDNTFWPRPNIMHPSVCKVLNPKYDKYSTKSCISAFFGKIGQSRKYWQFLKFCCYSMLFLRVFFEKNQRQNKHTFYSTWDI